MHAPTPIIWQINLNSPFKFWFVELFSYVHFLPVSAENEPKERHSRGRGSRIRFDILSPLRIPHTIGTGILLGSKISFLACRKKAIYLMDKRKSLYIKYCLGSTILWVCWVEGPKICVSKFWRHFTLKEPHEGKLFAKLFLEKAEIASPININL